MKLFRAPKCSTSWSSTATPRASSSATWSPGKISSHAADAVVLATGGYGNAYYLSTYARGCNATAIWRALQKGALFANPCYTQIHPTCIPVSGDYQSKLTLMSESLRNDGRVWVPKKKGRQARAGTSPRTNAIIISSASTRASATSRRATFPRAPRNRSATKAAASARRPRRLSRFRRRDQAARRRQDARALRQSLRHVSRDHERERLQDADAHLSRPSITRWAGCGWTTI